MTAVTDVTLAVVVLVRGDGDVTAGTASDTRGRELVRDDGDVRCDTCDRELVRDDSDGRRDTCGSTVGAW